MAGKIGPSWDPLKTQVMKYEEGGFTFATSKISLKAMIKEIKRKGGGILLK